MPDEKDLAQLTLQNGPEIGSRYRHYKGGEYEVVQLAINENDLQPLVIYKSLAKGTLWVRTFDDWNAKVLVDGKETTRFTRLD